MTELLTAAQMRAIEQAAIDAGEVTGLELMERAGRGVVDAIFAEWPELAQVRDAGRGGAAPPAASDAAAAPPEYCRPDEGDWVRRAVVLCGPGNNGGDGFVVARLLRERGWDVCTFLHGEPERLPPDAKCAFDLWVAGEPGNQRHPRVFPLTEDVFRDNDDERDGYADLYVDAIFGTGLRRPIEGNVRDVLTHMSGRNGDNFIPHTVAIDAPSGLCLDSGKILGIPTWQARGQGGCAEAAMTVTFHAPKVGHFSGEGPRVCGRVRVADIGLEGGSARNAVRLVRPPNSSAEARGRGYFWGLIDKHQGHGHKYTHGHALILSGPAGTGGAARLAARGALRIGAGLVTVGAPSAALAERAAQLNAIMLAQVSDAGDLAEVLKDGRINALCLGPGLGVDRARGLVEAALALDPDPGPRPGKGRSVVLDADALTAFADDPKTLFDMLHSNCVLTPHAGEFARLFPDIVEKLNATPTKGPAYSKVDATRDAASRAGCTVLFKGPDTVIADERGVCSINSAQYERAAPWLATAGSGDVLAGFITGLMARGFGSKHAAEAAAWLHVECALEFGPGLIAEDLPDVLPTVLRRILPDAI